MIDNQYEAVIGLEVHVQCSTASKMFCSCRNDSFGAEPNRHVCPVCLGHPGQLPVINAEAVRKGIRAALALKCSISSPCHFDRKNYFYPDLPKGYQISQYDRPLAQNGFLEIRLKNGESKKIGITRLHLEEDTGKLTHLSDGTLIDYNRSGVPLLEIVSEPDLRSAEEASLYAQELQRMVRVVDASCADMEKGGLRFDINVSLRPRGDKALGTKVEVKNLNSFKALEKALIFEMARQEALLGGGKKIISETRGWNDEREATISQRSKEEAQDYRYFPEPDLPPLSFSAEEIVDYQAALPELPLEKRRRYENEYALGQDEARLLSEDNALSSYFEETVRVCHDPGKSGSLILSTLGGIMRKENRSLEELKIPPSQLGALIEKINQGELSLSAVKTVIEAMVATGKKADEIIEEKNLGQISDQAELAQLCDRVVQLNTESVKDYRAGKERAFGYLVGQAMKASGGRANPQILADLLKQKLNS